MFDTSRLKILFIGNSITLHGPAPDIGWNGNWGMAASSEEHDYVRLVMDGVRRYMKEADFLRVNVADFERGYDQYDQNELRQYREYGADIIIMRILENVDASRFSDDSFGSAYAGLIGYLNPSGRARVLCVGSFWPCVRGDMLAARAAAENGYDFLSLSGLHGDDGYKALGLFKHAGVAAHPSDRGMAAIAELILGRVMPWLSVRSDFYDEKNIMRHTAGTLICEEGLYKGRWIARYFSPVGRVDENPQLYENDHLSDACAFSLDIDGQSLRTGWEVAGQGSADEGSAGVLSHVTLQNTIRPVRVTVHTRNDGTGVFTRWLEIENTGSAPAALSGLQVWRGRVFPAQAGDAVWGLACDYMTAHGPYSAGYFVKNRYACEGSFEWRSLGDTCTEITERSGKSGHGHPFVLLRDERAGQCFGLQLAWSGNWTLRLEPGSVYSHNNDYTPRMELLYAGIGPWSPAPMRVLAPGERIVSPEAHFGLVCGTGEDMTANLHRHQRTGAACLPPPERRCLISFNNAGYLGSDLDITEENLYDCIEQAALLGADVFTVDAGWYSPKGSHWGQHIGSWRVSDKLPRGLAPAFEYARSKGLKCGLWVWLEAASKKGPLVSEHPDWLIHRDGESLDYQLDLSKPEVSDHVERELIRIVTEHGLDLLRIDYNAYPGEGGERLEGGYLENTIYRHYEALYGILRRLSDRFPALIIENCASGGGRTDLGMLSHAHYTWVSDYALPPRVVRMLGGMTMALTPEQLAIFTGVGMNGHLGGDADLRLRVAMLSGNPCLLGMFPSMKEVMPESAEKIRRMTSLFHSFIRPVMLGCRVYHHTPVPTGQQPEGDFVLEYASNDASRAVIGIFRLAGGGRDDITVRPRGLARHKTYRVRFDNTGETVTLSGAALAENGVAVRLDSNMKSELLLISEEGL